jgi:hypothetical protein
LQQRAFRACLFDEAMAMASLTWLKQARICDGVVGLHDRIVGGVAWTARALRLLFRRPIPLTIWRPRLRKAKRASRPTTYRPELQLLESREGPTNLLGLDGALGVAALNMAVVSPPACGGGSSVVMHAPLNLSASSAGSASRRVPVSRSQRARPMAATSRSCAPWVEISMRGCSMWLAGHWTE